MLHGRLEVARVLDAREERERRGVEALRALAVGDALEAVVLDRAEERADLLLAVQVLKEAPEQHAVAHGEIEHAQRAGLWGRGGQTSRRVGRGRENLR